MHDAFEAVQVIQKLPASVQIESIASYDDILLAGVNTGMLLLYSISSKGSKVKADLSRTVKAFAKKPVIQLEVIPEEDLLLSISDSVVRVHSLKTLSLIYVLEKTRGASLFATNVEKLTTQDGKTKHYIKLCVVNRRRLQYMYWKPSQKEFKDLKDDMVVPEIPRALAWCESSICVGFKRDYFLIKGGTGELKELFNTGRYPDPLITRVGSSELALGRDGRSIFIGSDGLPTHGETMVWSEQPISVTHHHPYLLAVLPKYVEVRTIGTKTLVQSVDLPKTRLVCRANSTTLYMGSSTDVWRLSELPVDMQVGQLLTNQEYEMALMLASHRPAEVDDEMMNEIKLFYAFELFAEGKFEESLKIYSDLGIDPSYVIGLYPGLLPTEFCSQLAYPSAIPSLTGSQLEKALFSLVAYLTTERAEMQKGANTRSASASSVNEVSGLKKKSDRALRQIVDTTLLKCYLKVSDALVAPLLRLPGNSCDVEESEKALKQHGKYSELIILYETKGLHEQALELLQTEAVKGTTRELKGPDRTVEYLQRLGSPHLPFIFRYTKWVIQKHAQEAIKIFTEDLPEVEGLPRQEVVEFLEREDRDLLLQYLEHLVREWGDQTPEIHDKLATVYLDLINEQISALPEGQRPRDRSEESADLTELRGRLLHFLRTSEFYRAHRINKLFPLDRFHEEKAILLGKQGSHEGALAIYIHKLKDLVKAEEYCETHYHPTKEGAKDVYYYLMKHIITPSNYTSAASIPGLLPGDITTKQASIRVSRSGHSISIDETDGGGGGERFLPQAMAIVKKHPDRLDTAKALELLPDACTLRSVLPFLTDLLTRKAQQKRANRINRSLVHWDTLKVQEEAIHYRKNRFSVTEDTVCDFCRRRMHNSSFARYPNQDIVHLGCVPKVSALSAE